MPLLISVVNVPPTTPKIQDPKTKVQVERGRTANGKPVPYLHLYRDDGPYSRYLTELTVADRSSNLILQGGAQLVIAEKRLAGLMIMGELTNAAAKQKMKLSQDTGRMACFSVECKSLGLVGIPTNRRGKPTSIQLGTDINKADGFAIKVTGAMGYLNADGKTGPTTLERIVTALEECDLAVSRGVSIY